MTIKKSKITPEYPFKNTILLKKQTLGHFNNVLVTALKILSHGFPYRII